MATLIPYDDRDGQIWMDGKLIPWRDAKIHLLTHGLHYGSGVFEGCRAYSGHIFKLNEHSQRLIESAKILDMKMTWTVEQIDQACIDTLKASGLKDAYVRPVAWRGSEQMGVTAQKSKIHFAVAVWEWPNYFTPEMRENGLHLQTSRWQRPPAACAPVHSKAFGLYMICTLSKHAAENAGFHDALMLDYRGQVAEATGANFFMVKGGELHTPIPDCFLNGITRRTIIDLAKSKGIKVTERVIMPAELGQADECFLTGTAAEVTAIGKIDNHTYKVGPVTRMLRDEYEKLVRQPPQKSKSVA